MVKIIELKIKIITLCGSTKFKKEFIKMNALLTLKGFIVLSVGLFGHVDKINLSAGQKVKLDLLHLQKIDLSDEIYVIDVNSYIGESTQNEINYAYNQDKLIKYYSADDYKPSKFKFNIGIEDG